MSVRTSTPCARPPPPLQRTPVSPPLSWDGKPISSLQCGLPDKLQRCLGRADGLEQYLKKTPCSVHACDYLQTLKMRLQESERSKIEKYNDILDPHSLLRTQVHSLKGLMELAAFAGPQFSTEACALELLCGARCDIVDMLPSSPEILEKNPFHEAAKAAGHPLPLQLGELHWLLLLMPDERSALLSLMTEARTGRTVLRLGDMTNRVRHMWLRCSAAKTGGIVRAPELFPESRKLVSSIRPKYEERRSWFRSKIEQVLKDYTTQHFWEPKYKLDIISGVEAINQGRPPLGEMCYLVNFTATSDLQLERMLFFAEFLFSGGPQPETCCPLPYEYAGRCYYGEQTARKIVYPDNSKYIPHDITHYGTRRVDDMLEMDVVYFSSEMDVELAEKLNKMHAY
ncbi:hypothetical protein VPH35_134807 [Triticum aestivum]